MAKNLIKQILTEHRLYQDLFDAADDVLYCPHPGDPEKTGYPEDHHNDEAIPRLHTAFLALVDAKVPQLKDRIAGGEVLISLSPKLITKMLDALHTYYETVMIGKPLHTRDLQKAISGVVQALQSVTVTVAAHDVDVKERVRVLIVTARGVARGN